MLANTSFAHHVPTTLEENLQWRKKIYEKVIKDPSYANVIRNACAADPIFYVNGFLYTFDPRNEPPLNPRIPFILYPFQREGLIEIIHAIGSYDLLIEKTRDMGASWLNIVAFEYLWHFRKLLSFLMVSRTEDYVDKSDNPKSLFWKIDFIHENLPRWLMPKGYDPDKHRMKLHIKNPENGSVIDGESTTGQVARGDRRTAILLDEFAAVEQGHKVLSSTRDVTKCRLFNSTPEGINNAYYSIRQTNIKKLRFYWTQHPLKAAGLYIVDKKTGYVDIQDPKGLPENYKFVTDGKWTTRSPWFDEQCERCATDQEISQEVEIDYLGSGNQFFLSDSINEAIRKFAILPDYAGNIHYDVLNAEPSGFRDDEYGNTVIWGILDGSGNLPGDRKYVLGCDISAGTGNSNSVICGYDLQTNEKVLEYASPFIRPEEFARQTVAIATWMHGAYLAWESNGVGQQFGACMMELGYGNIYYRKKEESITQKTSLTPGWHATPQTKLALVGSYRDAVERQQIINKSKEALEECLEYVFNPRGGVSHVREESKEDISGAKHSHGDRVIADALAWRCMTERQVKPQATKPEIPIGSLAWRREQAKKSSPKQFRKLLKADGW